MLTIMFADDTSIFIQGNNIHEMEIAMDSEIKRISMWLKINTLSLNKKITTHTMTSSNTKSRIDRETNIYVDNINIDTVNKI